MFSVKFPKNADMYSILYVTRINSEECNLTNIHTTMHLHNECTYLLTNPCEINYNLVAFYLKVCPGNIFCIYFQSVHLDVKSAVHLYYKHNIVY